MDLVPSRLNQGKQSTVVFRGDPDWHFTGWRDDMATIVGRGSSTSFKEWTRLRKVR